MRLLTKGIASRISGLVALVFLIYGSAIAQERSGEQPPWKIGFGAGLNLNFIGVGFQNLQPPGNVGNFIPLEINDGVDPGAYIGLLGEYNSRSWWGAQLRLSFDVRSGTLTDNTTDPNKEFDARLSYLTIEPLLRINPPFAHDLYFTFGPLIGINLTDEFDFRPVAGEDPTVEGVTIPDISSTTWGVSGGVGYDILLNEESDPQWWQLSPFLEGSWMVNQRSSSFPNLDQNSFDDIWSTVTVRAGVRVTIGDSPLETVETTPLIDVSLFTPARGEIRSRKVEEIFPLARHVFFDSASTSIPARYVQLDADDASEFTENDLLEPEDIGNLTPQQRTDQQMRAYYNILNVYGSRMRANPGASITLIGSGGYNDDGETLAQNVKDYLTNNFGIDGSRIKTRSQRLPRKPSGSARTPKEDRHLANAENRRVEIVSDNPVLDQPVKVRIIETSPIDNDLMITINENEAKYTSWQARISGEGKSFNYGPYALPAERIDPTPLVADVSEGSYTAEIFVTTEDNQVIKEVREFDLEVVKDDLKEVKAERYSIIFQYGQTDAVKLYENFLRDEIAPKIKAGSNVIVHGHTDNIGDSKVNYRFSLKRAGEVRDILSKALKTSGVNANLEAVGFGEQPSRYTFDNALPEGRFYNRMVVIEIIPTS